MKSYLKWLCRQFSLFIFWPKQFNKENRDLDSGPWWTSSWSRFRYLVKVMPGLLLFAVIPFLHLDTSEGVYVEFKTDSLFYFIASVFGGVVGRVGFTLVMSVLVPLACRPAGVVEFQLVQSYNSLLLLFVLAFCLGAGYSILHQSGMASRFGVSLFAAFVTYGVLWEGLNMATNGDVGVGVGFVFLSSLSVAGLWIGRSYRIRFPHKDSHFGDIVGMVFGASVGTALGGLLAWRIFVPFEWDFAILWKLILVVSGGSVLGVIYAKLRILESCALAVYSSICYFFANLQSAPRQQWWFRHPLAWSDIGCFALPYAGVFLASLTRLNRQFGLEKIAFVLAERRHQKWAAIEAHAELTLDDLYAVDADTIAEVPQKLEWLKSPLVEPPEDLKSSIPTFTRIAEHVQQARVLQSGYRRMEAIEDAVNELDVLLKQLAMANGKYVQRLAQRANEWHSLLTQEAERLAAAAAEAREIPQVFRFGNPVRMDEACVFAGRADITRELESLLLADSRPPAILLHGPRRMGKSSILCQLPRLLGPGFVCCTLDCQQSGFLESKAAFLSGVSRKLTEALAVQNLRISPLERNSLRDEAFSVFDEWLQTVERIVPVSIRRIVIAFDEYEAMHAAINAGWGESLLDYLRHLQQHRPRFGLIFTGMRTFHALGREWTARFVSARRTRVSFLTAAELRPMLLKPVPSFQLQYVDGSLDRLLDLTHGQPFLTQAVAKELVDSLNLETRLEATLDDVEKAANKAIRSAEEYFWNVWDDAGQNGQAILLALAQGQTPPTGPTLSLLCDLDVVGENGQFTVPLFKRWVLKAFPDGGGNASDC